MSNVRQNNRKERVAFGVSRRKLNLDRETHIRLRAEGKIPRWINDEDHGNRLIAAQEGGYEFVEQTEGVLIGDAKIEQERDKRIKKFVGTNKDGSPKYAYLMAIPEKFYKEDQQKKEEINLMVDTAIRGGQPRGVAPHGINAEQGGVYVKKIEYQP